MPTASIHGLRWVLLIGLSLVACLPKPEPEETVSRQDLPREMAEEYCDWVNECLDFEEYGGDLEACVDMTAELFASQYSEDECPVFDSANAHDCLGEIQGAECQDNLESSLLISDCNQICSD